jgi:hypothetical protein
MLLVVMMRWPAGHFERPVEGVTLDLPEIEQPAGEPPRQVNRGVPPPPPMRAYVPPAPPASYREDALVQRKAEKNAQTYAACLSKGVQRLAAMHAPQRVPKAVGIFINEYVTNVVYNADSPTYAALETAWKQRSGTGYAYKNTPLPEHGVLLSWQNSREGAEPLTNADVYFYQYQTAWQRAHPGAALPRLALLRRQQSRAADTEAVLDHMRWERNDAALPVGFFTSADKDFTALLGTANGSGPHFLVVHYGDQLSITGIASIEVTAGQDLVFIFS